MCTNITTNLPKSRNSPNRIEMLFDHMNLRAQWWATSQNKPRLGHCVHIHQWHHLSTWGASNHCIRLQYSLHSRLLERCCKNSAGQAAHVYGVPSKTYRSLWELKQYAPMLFTWHRILRPIELAWPPSISGMCLQFLCTPGVKKDTIWTQS